MGEQTGTRLNHRSAACKFPSEVIRKKQLLRPRKIITAVGLSFILTTSLIFYLMLPLPAISPLPTPLQLTPPGVIAIDGDASFSATAHLEGWPGDGSPGNPYIIDGLDIDLGGDFRDCIDIRNTRVSFTISNCNLTGAYFGILLYNVTNGEIVNNTCSGNYFGIFFYESDSNTVVNNTCSNNDRQDDPSGIYLEDSDFNTVTNNTCSFNGDCGIMFYNSDSNIVDNNICKYNRYAGIYNSWGSLNNTVVNNTCSSNGDFGIHILFSSFINTVNNTCIGNGHYGICLSYSHNNTLVNNNCSNNAIVGIETGDAHSNTITNNICNRNNLGMFIDDSNLCTIVNNECSSNVVGIELSNSNSNVVADNICCNNRIGIYIYESSSNMVFNNTCTGNTQYDIYFDNPDTMPEMTVEFDSVVHLLIGLAGIIVLGAGRKLVTGIRKFD